MQYAHKNIVRLFPLKAEKKDEISAFYLQLKFRLSHYKQNEGGTFVFPPLIFNSVVYQSSDPLSKYLPGTIVQTSLWLSFQ